MENVKEFVIDYLEREYSLPKDADLDSFNYGEAGYVDSIGLIQFIAMIEDEFDITFTDEEITDPNFQIVGALTQLIEKKISEKA